MDSLGLVVHDEQTFLTKVVDRGMEEGLFTRDRADEIIRVSVAMANKYVLQKEVDFRSTDELARVQETILKLVGVGLEIRSKGEVDTGIRILMEASPVELFRLAYTRIDKLRSGWRQLLQDHRIQIFVSRDEFECLSDLTCQRLSEMSIFCESELHTIESLTLEDNLFSTLGLVTYYEGELERYEFILRLKRILPFDLLNRSPLVRAEYLSEVDCMREALLNTLVISGYVNGDDPVTVSMADVRKFLGEVDVAETGDIFPESLEDAMLDVIQELGGELDESEAAPLTREVIRTTQKFMETVASEWDTMNSSSENIFFKRWSRMVVLSDGPDPINRILASGQKLDEFDFELLIGHLLNRSDKEAVQLIEHLPWSNMTPDQIIRLFHELEPYQEILAARVSLAGFGAHELIDLIEGISLKSLRKLIPAVRKAFAEARFSLEDLDLLAGLPRSEAVMLLRLAGPPVDVDKRGILREFNESSHKIRHVLFHACSAADFFADLFQEAWSVDPDFVRREIKLVPAPDIGPVLRSAEEETVKIVRTGEKEPELLFHTPELNVVFKSLPAGKKKSAFKFFEKLLSGEHDSEHREEGK
ncbi:MAG TPA: DUF6178 family protein [Desulfomonilaceae bacterium]|nr:DUF6178 family protein [Desulfomonilaceae bacterium]